MKGWKVTTGATSAPSSAAITSLLPRAECAAAYLLQRPSVVSTGEKSRSATSEHGDSGSPPRAHNLASLLSGALSLDPFQGLDFGLSPGRPQPGLNKAQEPELGMRRAGAAAMPAGEGLSSGHSGSGHVDVPETKPSPAALAAAAASSPAAAGQQARSRRRTYELRSRSSSLRAAWVEADAEEEPVPKAEPEASADSEDDVAVPSGTEQDEEPAEGKEGEERSQPRKRVGRPLAYSGDPDAPHLTEQERRKIKRRIANRESARRVRAKRAELMDELQIKCTALGQQNARLLTHVALVENQKSVLAQQVTVLQEKLQEKAGEALNLYNQLFALRKMMQPELAAGHDAAAGTQPPSSPMPLQGTSLFVPIAHSSPPGFTPGAMQSMQFL